MKVSPIKQIEAYYTNYYAKLALVFTVLLLLVSGWDLGFMKYWKEFVVLIHEIFHVITASLTGGEIKKLILHGNESAEVEIIGSWKYAVPLIYISGYVGCILLGTWLLHLSFDEKKASLTLRFFSGFLLLNIFTFTEIFSYTWKIGFIWSIFIFLLSFANIQIVNFSLTSFGTAISLYGILDLKDFIYNIDQTDAGLLAKWILDKRNGLSFLQNWNIKELSIFIAICIIVINFGILLYYLYKIFFFTKSKDEASLKRMLKEYKKGTLPEDVINWFLKRELNLDGRPISKETIDKLRKGENFHE